MMLLMLVLVLMLGGRLLQQRDNQLYLQRDVHYGVAAYLTFQSQHSMMEAGDNPMLHPRSS